MCSPLVTQGNHLKPPGDQLKNSCGRHFVVTVATLSSQSERLDCGHVFHVLLATLSHFCHCGPWQRLRVFLAVTTAPRRTCDLPAAGLFHLGPPSGLFVPLAEPEPCSFELEP